MVSRNLTRVAAAAMVVLTACGPGVAPDATGPEIYDALCVKCHEPDLSGGRGPALGPGSQAAMEPDEYLLTTISRGSGRMPSFGGTLSEEQIGRLVEYLRRAQAGT